MTDTSWYPGDPENELEPPIYTAVPIIVVTNASPTLVQPERHLWWTALRSALAAWQPSGLTFPTREEELNPYYPWKYNGIAVSLTKLLEEGINGVGDWIPGENGGGYVLINETAFRRLMRLHDTALNHKYAHRKLRMYIAHEMGHALGFLHGGTGCMMGGWRPNQEELDACRNYYLA